MKAVAIVVGVDQYAEQPLTSAVRDAVAFRDALVELSLVEPAGVTLLTSPAQAGGQPATRKQIRDALRRVYDHGLGFDRLYLYFSGHGLLVPTDAAHTRHHTLIVPADVDSLADDADRLISIEDLRDYFRFAGPREQFFFVDACRDLAFGEYPVAIPPLAWPASANPSGLARGQATLYAVAPRARALGARDGMGVMTGHLIEALHGKGLGIVWCEDEWSFGVTAESVRKHVRWRVCEAIETRPLWEQQYMLPQLEFADPPLSPIRLVPDPPPASLTVVIEPDEAASATRVTLAQGLDDLREPSWPPSRSRDTVYVRPRRYEVRATSTRGRVEVNPRDLDVRQQGEVRVRVVPETAPPPPPPLVPGPGPALVARRHPVRATDPGAVRLGFGTVRAYARDEIAVIELEGLEPPYRRWSGGPRLEEAEIPPGFYRVRFRVGSEVYSETELKVGPGADVQVMPTVAVSPLVCEALGIRQAPEQVVLARSIGPLQAGLSATLLALIGITPFDTTAEWIPLLEGRVPRRSPGELDDRPLSLVVAVDGTGWPIPVEEIVGGIECELVAGTWASVPVAVSPLERTGTGFGRVAVGYAPAPSGSFSLVLRSPYWGRLELAAAALDRRATVITVTVRPNGSLDVTQNLLPIPGWTYDVPVPAVAYGRRLRDLQLGQRLYENGELVERGDVPAAGAIRELLNPRWPDPIVGCMAALAWEGVSQTGTPVRRLESAANLASIVINLERYFPDLPDLRVIAARTFPDRADELVAGLLDEEAVPVLAQSARTLARLARDRGYQGTSLQSRAARLVPGTPWALTWDLPLSPDANGP